MLAYELQALLLGGVCATADTQFPAGTAAGWGWYYLFQAFTFNQDWL